MSITEVLTLAISVITVAVAVYKAAKNGTLLKTVITGVEDAAERIDGQAGTTIKATIANHALKAGLGEALNKLVQKITKK